MYKKDFHRMKQNRNNGVAMLVFWVERGT